MRPTGAKASRAAALGALLLLGACAGTNRADMLTKGEGTSARGVRVAGAALAGGIPEAALHATRQVLERDPGNVDALMKQADALTELGRPDAAAEAYRRVLGRDASPSREQAREARIGLGRVDLAAGRGAQAEATYRAMVADSPDNAAAHSGLGIALDLQGRHRDAQAEYRKSLALTDSDGTRANLGLSLAMAGDSTGAVEMLRPIAADPAASTKVRHNLAFALELAGDRRGAERTLGLDLPRDQVAEALSGFDAFRVAAVPAEATPLAGGAPIVLNPPAAVASAAPAAPTGQPPAGQPVVLATSLLPPAGATAVAAGADQPIVLSPPVAEARPAPVAKPARVATSVAAAAAPASRPASRPAAARPPVVQVAAAPIAVPPPAAAAAAAAPMAGAAVAVSGEPVGEKAAE